MKPKPGLEWTQQNWPLVGKGASESGMGAGAVVSPVSAQTSNRDSSRQDERADICITPARHGYEVAALCTGQQMSEHAADTHRPNPASIAPHPFANDNHQHRCPFQLLGPARRKPWGCTEYQLPFRYLNGHSGWRTRAWIRRHDEQMNPGKLFQVQLKPKILRLAVGSQPAKNLALSPTSSLDFISE